MVKYLCQRIGEEMEKFREYNALSGLRAVELATQGGKKAIPEQGRIGDHLKDCDELICDLVSDDLWLYVKYEMECGDTQKSSAMELQVNKSCTIAYLRWTLEKLALNLWSFLQSSNPIYYYVLKAITLKIVFAPNKYIIFYPS